MKNKTLITLLFLVICIAVMQAQSITPLVIANSGNSGKVNGGMVHLSWTMGETISGTLRSSSNVTTQGFHQPVLCPLIVTNLKDTICLGEEYKVGASVYTKSGSYIDVLKTERFGVCDSMINLELTVIDPEKDLPKALAEDLIVCEQDPVENLRGTPPSGEVNGIWTACSPGLIIVDPEDPRSLVRNLLPGENCLTWTLSNKFCVEYDEVEVSIFFDDAKPVANPDNFVFALENEVNFGNVLLNDTLPTTSTKYSWEVDFFSVPPTFSSTGNLGEFSLTTEGLESPELVVAQEFFYELRNANCPLRTDRDTVSITFETSAEFDKNLVVTPNGDGKNDLLVFPELALFPEKFKKNNIVIFNRWGDVVFKAAPYNNDWDGTNMRTGQILPSGTYYYILRLALGDARIKQGQITILK
ncbi:MAG: gliding motility-associated C-terminal domain-containing protein [Saprospiraceae bacterium]